MLSVLMTVYAKEDPRYLRESLESIHRQTLQPDEIVLVKDGELTEALDQAIEDFQNMMPLRLVSLPWGGHGKALRAGVESARGDFVAIMDTDDISVPHRLEAEMKALADHPEVDAVGSAIAEFETDPVRPQRIRRLPGDHDRIAAYAKRRNPFNHMSVMFRRGAVLRAGNYRHCPGFEDWHLWTRMIQSGSRFMNLDEALVLVRVGNGMLKRRSGLKYIRQEIHFHREMRKRNLFSSSEILRNLMLRIPTRLAPDCVLRTVYATVLRSPWNFEHKPEQKPLPT